VTGLANVFAYNAIEMTAPATLFRPFSRLVKITLMGKNYEVPENNTLLRCFQYLAPEGISYGRFCWNEDCQYCRISFDMGEGTKPRAALSCKLMVEEGMRITEVSGEIRYCLRSLKL
jgi:predicted molibdopterin-dependent oxidoreductase YjgC